MAKTVIPVAMVLLGASVFASINNFQTVYADFQKLNFSHFFIAYTVTVIACRIVLVKFDGGSSPYRFIGLLLTVMAISSFVFSFHPINQELYVLAAILLGIGHGASYPLLSAMVANDSKPELTDQTLQFFSLCYFIGVFGFPFIAGWIIVDFGIITLMQVAFVLALIEAALAFIRHYLVVETVNEHEAVDK